MKLDRKILDEKIDKIIDWEGIPYYSFCYGAAKFVKTDGVYIRKHAGGKVIEYFGHTVYCTMNKFKTSTIIQGLWLQKLNNLYERACENENIKKSSGENPS